MTAPIFPQGLPAAGGGNSILATIAIADFTPDNYGFPVVENISHPGVVFSGEQLVAHNDVTHDRFPRSWSVTYAGRPGALRNQMAKLLADTRGAHVVNFNVPDSPTSEQVRAWIAVSELASNDAGPMSTTFSVLLLEDVT